MVHYVGLDVSLKQTSICVVNQLSAEDSSAAGPADLS
jgi:hypothetical protein